MSELCVFLAGVAVGLAWALSSASQPCRDDASGIYTLHYNGGLYELVRLLGAKEAIDDEKPK